MSYIQQFFTSRDNNANAETFVGQEGRLWWDPVTNQIYSSDGNTPGGIPLSGGGGNGSPGGANSQIQFNSNGTFGGTANLTIDRNTGQLSTFSLVAVGNVDANFFNGDGSALTNLPQTYTDANVASYLPTYTGNLNSLLGNVTTTANVSAGYFIGNGSQLTGITTTYGNANVAAYLPTYTGNLNPNFVNASGNLDVDGSATIGGNLFVTGNINFSGNVNQISGNSGSFFGNAAGIGALYAGVPVGYSNVITAVIQATSDLNDYTQINAQNLNHGNTASMEYVVTADIGTDTTNYLDMGIAGSGWDGTQVNSLGNAVAALDGWLYVQGGVSGGNLILGTTSAGKTIKFNASGPNAQNTVAEISTTGFSTTGNVTSRNIFANVAAANVVGTVATAATVTSNAQPNITSLGNLTSVTVTGNVTGGNVNLNSGRFAGGSLSVLGAVTGGSITTAGNLAVTGNATITGNTATGNLSVTGNVNAGNLRTTGVVSALGGVVSSGEIYSATAVTGGNVSGATVFATGNVTGGNILTGGSVSATGNITSAANIAGGNISATGSINLAGQISAVGNITGGNILTGANVSATSNVTGGNLISNGVITTVGNVVANYFVGNGAALYAVNGSNITGTVANATYAVSAGSATTAATVTTNAQPNITSVGTLTSVASSGNISTTGNVTGNYFVGNGSQLTGISASSNRIFNGTSNVEIATASGNVTITAAAGNTWTFDTSGALTLPGATAGENIATQSGYITVGNLLIGQGGALFNSNNDSWALYGNLSDSGTTIFIPSNADAGNGLALYFENQISNVEIRSGGTWVFDTNGVLRLPEGTAYISSAANALSLHAGGNESIYMSAASGGISVETNSNVTILSNVDGTTNYAWTFDNTGNLTAPGVITANTFVSNAYNVLTAGNLSITSQYGLGVTGTILEDGGTLELIGSGTGLGTSGCVIVGWNSSYGAGLGPVAQMYFNPPGSSGNAVITTGNLAATSYEWNFDKTGNLTAPGAISATGNVTGGNVIGTTGVSVGGTGGDLTMTGGAITGVGNFTSNGVMAINAPGGITTTQTSFDIVNATATTVNLGGSATAVNIGATTGTLTLNNPTIVGTQTSLVLFNTVATSANVFGAASNIIMGATSGTMTLRNPTIVGTQTTQNLFNTVATTVNFAGAATTLNIGGAGNATFSANTLVRIANTSGTALSVAGNITGGNILTGGVASATGNVTGGNIITAGLATVTGNITGGNLISTGAVYSNYNTNTANTGSFMAQGGNTKGGTGYLDFLVAQNTSGGATNPYKWLRLSSAGALEIINSAYSATILSLSDTGGLSIPGPFSISGKQAVNGPAFSAYANATLQTITSGSQQKVLFQTEEFDTNNNYASSRFTPTVEGYYQLNAEVRLDGVSGTGEMMIVIWKNGSGYKRGTNQSGTQIASNFWAMQVSSVVYANGTTDYFEIYVQQGSGGNVTVTAVNDPSITWFNGCMLRGA